jgi:hypothetical protein
MNIGAILTSSSNVVSLQKIATDIYDYLQSHHQDPDNSLIGLSPPRSIAKNVIKETKPEITSETNYTQEELIKMILSWSDMKDDKAIAEKVKRFAQTYRANLTPSPVFQKGNLLIAKVSKNIFANTISSISSHQDFSLVYGRYIEDSDLTTTNIKIYLTPHENEVIEIPKKDAYPLTDVIRESLGEVRGMDRLVMDPANSLCDEVMESVKQLCTNWLVEYLGVSSTQIEKWLKNSFDIFDLPLLRKTVKRLEPISKSPPLDLFQRIDQYTLNQFDHFYTNAEHGAFFLPTKARSITQLAHFQSSRTQLAPQQLKVKSSY